MSSLFLVYFSPAFTTPTTPTSDFIDNGNGTVTHKKTGIMWMRCSMGQTWSNGACLGTASTYTYDDAIALKPTFAGYSDWRLPNIAELPTIVEREDYYPSINRTIFPDTPINAFWSSSLFAGDSNNAWEVDFSLGYNIWNGKGSSGLAVRLVRGGSWKFGSLPLTTPSSDFADNPNGTVIHKRTGLMWQRCEVGQTWSGVTCLGSSSFKTYTQAMALTSSFAGYTDWHVPTIDELMTIVEYGRYAPAINSTLFPNASGTYTWSSTSRVDDNASAWISNFSTADSNTYDKTNTFGVRLVRGKWAGNILSYNSANVVLFLHGMNSNAGTWNDVVTQYFANCPSVYNGKINATAKPNAQKTYCYRINFGAYDADSPNKGLEDAWDFGETNGYRSAGDYSTFNQLGIEVSNAVSSIKAVLPKAKILLVSHSRGGLAGRAFLQNSTAQAKSGVVGLITTGTPHNGTRIGRFYNYIANAMLNADGTRKTDADSVINWQVVDLLSGKAPCNLLIGEQDFNIDARRPVIGYLADTNPMITNLNNNQNKLPTTLKYGQIVYNGLYLGSLSFTYNLFDEWGTDICTQLTTPAAIFIKGGSTSPTPSSNYPGDGIVPTASQGLNIFPTATKITYTPVILIRHTKEPKQTAHIADMTCQLGFPWLTACTNAPTIQAKAPFKPVEVVSHDYDVLIALKTEQLWQNWLALITNDAKTNQREQLAVALGIKLRSNNNVAFYADIEQRLFSINTKPLERARLAKLLAEIATPSALNILTQALLHPDTVTTQTALSNAIQDLADSLPENPRRANLSAVLEAAWTTPKQNQVQMNTLAISLAKLGTPRGVDLLLNAVEKTGATLPSAKNKTLNDAEKQAIAAFNAMDEIINPDSETVLSSAFMSHRATEAVFIAAGNGLVNLGRETAAQQVLQRLNELPDNAVPVGQQWLNHLSGKIEKNALRNMSKAVKMPRQPLLRQQMEEIVK